MLLIKKENISTPFETPASSQDITAAIGAKNKSVGGINNSTERRSKRNAPNNAVTESLKNLLHDTHTSQI